MFKTADVSTPGASGTHEESLEAAHRMISKLAGHIGHLTKMLDAHEARLNSHDNMHNGHSQLHGQHDQRLRALEAAAGRASPHPAYGVTKAQLKAMGQQFRENMRAGR